MGIIFLSTKSKKKEVNAFIENLNSILRRKNFNIKTDFILIRKKKEMKDIRYSTPYTLIDLDYNIEDVIECLKELKVEEYSETKIDRDDLSQPLLFVFGKKINKKLIYIKLKIKEENGEHVVCVSFHYAKEKMMFPYA